MTIKQGIVLYLCTVAIMVPLDFVWLGWLAKSFYQSELAAIMLPKPRLGPAVAFYLLYAAGIVFFAIMPALQSGSWTTALIHGALFGLVAYATYDLSNLATLRDFSARLALVDLAWGTVVTALSAVGGYSLWRVFGSPV